MAALSVAGIPCERFVFLGFLPRESGPRRRTLAAYAAGPLALIAYEAPHRLLDTLADLDHLVGDRPMAALSELTKLFEETRRGTPAGILAHYRAHTPRGEFTLVIAGLPAVSSPQPSPSVPDEGRNLRPISARWQERGMP
jgi:16S rRNA (cytidine1402-2'-O)-methyltransferase